jgi:ribonucleoside-diphosphate reductase alpha chain
MEAIAFYAYEASSDLAAESAAAYSSFRAANGAAACSARHHRPARGGARVAIKVPRGGRMDWNALREKIQRQGMRNSNVLAIAPTATISNIMGSSPCIEPTFKNLFVKGNLSGDFIVLNTYLVRDLKKLGLWGEDMVERLKYYDGELGHRGDPGRSQGALRTAFSIDYHWLIEAAARRQKWIDQSQSVNLFLAKPDMKTLSHMYRDAWHAEKGLKTTYYLRTLPGLQHRKGHHPGERCRRSSLPSLPRLSSELSRGKAGKFP